MKTSELTGPALNWAVHVALGNSGASCDYRLEKYEDEDRRHMCEGYSTNWAQGGPIIEREKIDLEGRWNTRGCGVRTGFKEWYANHPKNHGGLIHYIGYGPTPLVAAMRCYVASKLGDEVEIPEELK